MAVYLAGPITGLTYGECTDWRQCAIADLAASGIVGISPMRCKEFLAKVGVIHGGDHGDHLGIARPSGYITRDRFDVQRCDVVLINLLGAKTVSIGTMVEIGWADACRKPIVLVIEPGNVHHHGFVDYLTHYKVETLQDGLTVVKAILA